MNTLQADKLYKLINHIMEIIGSEPTILEFMETDTKVAIKLRIEIPK